MLLFYGWKDKNAPEARAFLLHEGTVLDPVESISTNKKLHSVAPMKLHERLSLLF
jgi:hypothetical protein